MDWWQQTLTPVEVVEFTLKLGVVPSADHVQWWIESKDPTTGILIGQASYPHGVMARLPHIVDEACRRLATEVHNRVDPF